MGWWSNLQCRIFGHESWATYRDPPRGYSICVCDRCDKVSMPLDGVPTAWRLPTFTETVFLRDNFKLVYPRPRNRRG